MSAAVSLSRRGGPTSGSAKARPSARAASRARPRWLIPSGRFAVISTSKTVSAPEPSTPSTMKPTAVRRSPSAFGSGAGPGRYDAIHSCENFTASAPHAIEEAHVVLEEQAQVRYPVDEKRDAVDAHAEREARVLLGVDPSVPQHGGMDHPSAQDLDPAGARAGAAGRAARVARRPA